MARFMSMVFVAIMVVTLAHSTMAQTLHVVGDNLGWTVPQNGASAYTTWAANKRFIIGDILTFNFETNAHDVLQVPKASFDACTEDNPIGTMITTGPANVTLNTTGEHYFICTIGRHCIGGQKLAITVVATSDSPLPSPSPTSPTTPSPTSNTPTDCVPSPTSGPTSSTPSSLPDPNVNSNSSYLAVFGSFLLSMLALSMGLIF